MFSSALLACAGLFVASTSAQESLADLIFYNSETCGDDANDPNLLSFEFSVLDKVEIVDGEKTAACTYQTIDIDGWTQEGGRYQAYLDQAYIPPDCEVVIFSGPPIDEELNRGACFSFDRRVPSDNKCAFVSLNPTFGMS